MDAGDELFWNVLLHDIEAGKVIPIIGSDLVTVREGANDVSLYSWIASRLAAQIGLDQAELPHGFGLNDVVMKHRKRGGDHGELYARIISILQNTHLAPSTALQSLAGISGFNVFVSLTFDMLLTQAIVNSNPNSTPVQIAWTPNELSDLSMQRGKPLNRIVFHLLGHATSSFEYAICDEDLLNYICMLQDHRLQPTRLFANLRTKHLLILGCDFSDWLACFFLRAMRGIRFSNRRDRSDIWVGHHDSTLVSFLQNYSKESRVVPMSAHEFVLELGRRWHEKHPPVVATALTSVTSADAWEAGTEPPHEGSVFISYATEDFEIARTLVKGLRAAGVDCWFDRNNLEPGAAWANTIERGIGRSALFLPIISKTTAHSDNRDRYFWREWNIADRRARGMAPDMEFVVPVMVDETRIDKLPIQMHDTFTKKQSVSLPGGQVTNAFAKRILQLQRAFRRRQR